MDSMPGHCCTTMAILHGNISKSTCDKFRNDSRHLSPRSSKVLVSMPVPGGTAISFDTAILSIDVTFLVLLDVIKDLGQILDLQDGTRRSHSVD